MKKRVFRSVTGTRTTRGAPAVQTRNALQQARVNGFYIGRQVRIGTVTGTIIGYNIAGRGCFHGAKFPLVVQTPFGVAKCSLGEIQLA